MAVAETVPPSSTFFLLSPNTEKMTQIARCFRISVHRALDEVCFSTFLVPLAKRLILDRDQLDPFGAFFSEKEDCHRTARGELPDLRAEHF